MSTATTKLEGQAQRTTRRVVLWGSRALSYLVYAYLLAVEVILFLGFFLLLFGASPSAGFTEWVYRSLDRAMEPFRGIFTAIELGTTAGNDIPSVFDTSVLFAMIVYGIVALVTHAFIVWLTSRLNRIEIEEAELRFRETVQAETATREQAADAHDGFAPSDLGGSHAVTTSTEPRPLS